MNFWLDMTLRCRKDARYWRRFARIVGDKKYLAKATREYRYGLTALQMARAYQAREIA